MTGDLPSYSKAWRAAVELKMHLERRRRSLLRRGEMEIEAETQAVAEVETMTRRERASE